MKNDVSAQQVARFILRMIRPFSTGIGVMLLVAVVWAIDVSLRPYILKIMLNRVSVASPEEVFDQVLPIALAFLGISFLISTVFRLYGYFVEIKMIPALRRKIAGWNFDLLLGHSHSYYQNHFAGSLASKLNDLVSSVPDLLQILIDRFFSHVLAVTIAIYALWQVHVKFALAMFGWVALFLTVSIYFSKRLSELSDHWSEWGSTITGRVVDVLSNILSVRLFARRSQERDSMDHVFQQTVQAERKLQWSYFWIWFLYGYSFVAVLAFNLYFLLKGREEGILTVGDFSLVLMINISIVDFMWVLTREFSQFSKFWGKITQALRTVTVPIEIEDQPQAQPLVVTQGRIMFEQVQFNYKSAEPLFQNKSVVIEPGQKVGLVGYSGSGKSTFVNLILRLFDVTSGRILIDGQDIREVTQDSLRSAIGMIPQDPSLFHRTLMENIRYGLANASDDEVIQAAEKAHAHEFIVKLAEGYQSLVGERGVKVSGGQRQRIAIARAILKNAPILILDEATSQLDSLTENEIQHSLWELMFMHKKNDLDSTRVSDSPTRDRFTESSGKTTLVIAHRLSTLLHMDRILVFDQGKIVEDGTHSELLSKKGLYRTLWDAQVGGFLPEVRTL